jgi:glycosyltransferase involved in cell wall biosynthesis
MAGNGGPTGRRLPEVGGGREHPRPNGMPAADAGGDRMVHPIPPLRVLHLVAYGNLAGTEMSATLLAKGQAACGLQPTVAILYQGGPIEEILRREGIPAVRVGATTGQAHLALRRLADLTRDIKPDVLHAHDLRWWSAVVGRLVHRAPRILTIHHQMVVGPAAWRWRLKYRIARRCYEGFAAVSAATLRSVTEQVPLPHGRCVVIPNGIPVEAYRSRGPRTQYKRRYGCEPDQPVVGFVGRLSPEKGVDDFLRTCREILVLEPRARFWILGDGEEAGGLRALAKQLGLEARVTFWGNRPEAADMLPAMDALLLTSHRETFGLVLLEAMAAEVPILGFVPGMGGVLEVVPSPEVARLLPERDPARLAELVVEVLRIPAERNRLTDAALRHVQRHFTLSRVTDQYLRLYLQLLETRAGRTRGGNCRLPLWPA